MKTTKYLLSTILCFGLLSSCSDDDDGTVAPPVEEEVITNVSLIFTNAADATDTVTLEWEDPDGEDGPLAPSDPVITGNFTAGTTYSAVVDIYNAIEEEDITEEVIDEAVDEHFFIYAINGLDMTFSRSDNDVVRTDGNKLGFRTTWVANAVGTGSITIRLFHESETVDDSNELGTQSGGSTDIDITFMNIEIQ